MVAIRTNISFRLVCAECGGELEACNKKSKVEFGSASEATAKMAVLPCRECSERARRPVELFKKALWEIEHFKGREK